MTTAWRPAAGALRRDVMPQKPPRIDALTDAELYRGVAADHAAQDPRSDGAGMQSAVLDEQVRVEMLYAVDRLVAAIRATDDLEQWMPRGSYWWPDPAKSLTWDGYTQRFRQIVEQLRVFQQLNKLDYSPSFDLFSRVLFDFAFPTENGPTPSLASPEKWTRPVLGLEDAQYQMMERRNLGRRKLEERRLFEAIRTELRSKAHARQLSRRKEAATEHYKSGKALLDKLFIELPELLVVRVDLGYLPGHWPDLAKAREDVRRFWNISRAKKYASTFASLAGYIKKLEYTYMRGYHFHLILLFDARAGRDVAIRIQELEKFWRNMSHGRGKIFDCRQSLNEYNRAGIGIIHRNDLQSRAKLLKYGLEYLVFKDLCLKPKRSGARAFETSQFRSLQTKRGQQEKARQLGLELEALRLLL
ncbi:hypothetical protein ABID97_003614 [Variovorax sp. OAS795]|uniref:hypothetical protein n=1 Tax=Variovorax sp. OAS795 TaxID=3034231 RepID=UPI003393A4D5